MTSPNTALAPSADRRYYIDVLRVLATLLLIYFHTARAFDLEPWHVRNAQLSFGMDLFKGFISIWHVALFFLLAGASAYLALRLRSGRQFTSERVRRLFIPFVVGVLLVVPPQVYLERISTALTRQSPIDFHGSFLQFYPHFFEGLYPHGNLGWHHLWFVIYLFVISLALLPLFLSLRDGRPGAALRARFTAFVSRGRNIFFLALPLVVIDTALRGVCPGPPNDWAAILHYATVMFYGFLLVSDRRLEDAAERNIRLGLIGGMLPATGGGLLWAFGGFGAPYTAHYFALWTLLGPGPVVLAGGHLRSGAAFP